MGCSIALSSTAPIFSPRPKPSGTNPSLRYLDSISHHGGTETRRKTGENQLHRGGAETRRRGEEFNFDEKLAQKTRKLRISNTETRRKARSGSNKFNLGNRTGDLWPSISRILVLF